MEQMEQNFENLKGGDQPGERKSYDSLSRKTSSAIMGGPKGASNASSLTLMSQRDHDRDGDNEEVVSVRQGEEKRRRKSGGVNSDAIGQKLKEELCKYKQELKEYNETTKDLEEKYMKINYELNEMQQKHDHFVAKRVHSSAEDGDENEDSDADLNGLSSRYYGSSSSVNSEDDDGGGSSKCKSNKLFCSNTSFVTVLSADNNKVKHQRKTKSHLSAQVMNQKLVETLAQRQAKRRKRNFIEDEQMNSSINDVYNVLKDVINTSKENKYKTDRETGDITQLYSTIKSLRSEQMEFQQVIRQQQDRISDYHSRCVKAQEIMKTQKHEIDKLHINNKHLESSIYNDIDTLRSKIDTKLKNVSHLPQMMRDEHSKFEKVMRENCLLTDKLRVLQQEANQLKVKIDELGRRKMVTINRLKAAERDLKIFKNYNTALKSEKRRLSDELSAVKEQLEQLQATSKRQLARYRDQSEKQRRDLQKRIFDLELKLSRSQNSTSSLIQERDSLIAELQTQLHTLVHNFEVSQKHIRVLRRHIYSMTNSSGGGANSGAVGVTGSGGGGGGGGAGVVNPTIPRRTNEAGIVRLTPLVNNIGNVPRLSNPRTLTKNKS
ncbi:myosin heavy chain, clone 203 [Drosophila tropicalis]|uniref:myosin heavy chain, clone 203 n=1 Tax=Drosophila tropicalis TaxID=46794 RepID=UPI0035AC07C3